MCDIEYCRLGSSSPGLTLIGVTNHVNEVGRIYIRVTVCGRVVQELIMNCSVSGTS